MPIYIGKYIPVRWPPGRRHSGDTETDFTMYSPRNNTDSIRTTSPSPGEPPKHHDSERAHRGPRQYHRNHGKIPRHRRNYRPPGRQKEKSHNGKYSSSAPKYPWHSTKALELGLHPRPFEELHAERVYLLTTLQSHDRQALELFRRLPVLDEYIDRHHRHHQHQHQQHNQYQNAHPRVKVKIDGVPVNEVNSQERKQEAEKEEERLRDARRQRVWLRRQIEDTVDVERDLLTRLSELHVEIQCRERWCQVGQERAEMLHDFERGGDRSGFADTPYQQPLHSYQYPNQDSLLHPNTYSYQPSLDIATGYPLSPRHPGSSAITLDHDFGGQACNGESPPLAAEYRGSLEVHGTCDESISHPASSQAGRGLRPYVGSR
ncbi:hypothetical protein F5Y12DRAFT_12851 [Xylaria sp. FL1777]|nr:hypothetical protein F5Y12DRAFT_12851 [Xylaria sp. FL1777]